MRRFLFCIKMDKKIGLDTLFNSNTVIKPRKQSLKYSFYFSVPKKLLGGQNHELAENSY